MRWGTSAAAPAARRMSHALEGGELRLLAGSSRAATENARSVIPDERGKREAVVAQIPKDVTLGLSIEPHALHSKK